MLSALRESAESKPRPCSARPPPKHTMAVLVVGDGPSLAKPLPKTPKLQRSTGTQPRERLAGDATEPLGGEGAATSEASPAGRGDSESGDEGLGESCA